MYKLGLEKAEEPELKVPKFIESWRKQGSSRTTSTSASLTTLKPLCESLQTVENFSTDGTTRPPYLPPEKPYAGQEAAVRTGHGKNRLVQNW